MRTESLKQKRTNVIISGKLTPQKATESSSMDQTRVSSIFSNIIFPLTWGAFHLTKIETRADNEAGIELIPSWAASSVKSWVKRESYSTYCRVQSLP